MASNDLRAQILAIQNDSSLTESEKAIKRQRLLTQSFLKKQQEKEKGEEKNKTSTQVVPSKRDVDDDLIGENLKCLICMNVCTMPVTAVCQHNFCLSCLKKWLAQGKKNCVLCRTTFSHQFINNPRINTTIVALIRAARRGSSTASENAERLRLARNQERPDEAFTTEKAQKTGLANAASGRLMVTCPTDTFGPIGPQYDPEKKRGLVVGDCWPNRLTCRQYGAHFPHVAGIAGQSTRGAQSVVLSGGYIDNVDEGFWVLYTGTGGRDLSGNKRTAKEQDFDQEFSTSGNAALFRSCELGLPLRVVRSHKEKRSSYAPPPLKVDERGNAVEGCVRYDGIYRIEKCWRKPGADEGKHLVCRYLMVRCDNEPAPFSSEEHGDRPDAKTHSFFIKELRMKYELSSKKGKSKKAPPSTIHDFFERDTSVKPAWDWNPVEEKWGWTCDPPASGQGTGTSERKKLSESEKLIKEFACDLSTIKKKGKEKHVMKDPVTAPCGHSFCRVCLTDAFKGMGDDMSRGAASGRSFRKKKIIKACPICKADITECVNNMQVNRDFDAVIQRLQAIIAKNAPPKEAEAIGWKVGVWWNDDKMFYEGSVKAYNEEDQKHKILYDDGTEEWLDLSKEKLEWKKKEAGEGSSQASVKCQPCQPAQDTAAPCPPANDPKKGFELKLDTLAEEFPGVDRGLISELLKDQEGDIKDVAVMIRRMTNHEKTKEEDAQEEEAQEDDKGRKASSGYYTIETKKSSKA